MASDRYVTERLHRQHNRTEFDSGEIVLDQYLQRQARQDDERNVTKVFVLQDPIVDRIAGYYSLSASAVDLERLPESIRRRLPRFSQVPVILLARLAIAREYQGRRLGEALLFDALRRAYLAGTESIGATAVIVDALHDHARAFYERYDFQRLPDQPYRLHLPMSSIETLLRLTSPPEESNHE